LQLFPSSDNVDMTQSEQGCGFAFTAHDRRHLAAALAQAQDVKFFRRLQVLLYLAEGGSVDTAAHFARVDRSTVIAGCPSTNTIVVRGVAERGTTGAAP
jgi:hypothetical protein